MKPELTQDKLKELLRYDPETGVFTWKAKRRGAHAGVGDSAGGVDTSTGYLRIRIYGHRNYAHRLAFLYMTGSFPSNHVDHIDGDKKNNQWNNLRAATQAENCRNMSISKRNASGITGVSWSKERSRWVAAICLNGKQTVLGRYGSLIDAVAARKRAESEYGYHENHGRRKVACV